MKLLIAIGLCLAGCGALSPKQQRRFPDDFLFGTATASYQIEGAWNADDKGENIWDHMTHTKPHVIKDQSNGDIAADTYHNYKRDVEMMRELGLDAYRFSLSWSRILPDGFSNRVSKAGVTFYNNYIDEMLKYGITPMITLYHWDLPQKLQELGGFVNPLFPDWFEDYARVVFEHFGDRVKHWITFNEPREICYQGYDTVEKAPQLNATGVGAYLCAKSLVLAHAKAYHAYRNDFAPSQGGQCGITISVNWFGAKTDSEEDQFAAELYRQGEWGLYAEPIFSEKGGFPKELSERVAHKSLEQGYPRSRMPEFTDEERAFVRGSADFFGVNHYMAQLVSAGGGDFIVPSVRDDVGATTYVPDEWPVSASSWLTQAPDSMLNALTHLKEKYNSPAFYITENGWSSPPEAGLLDDDRIRYYRAALESALDSLDAGVNLKGYMAWSLMDNFEWMEGYTERFGLYQVDFEDPARSRTPRKSAFVYKQIVKSRVIDHEYEPGSMTMTIDEGRGFQSRAAVTTKDLERRPVRLLTVECFGLTTKQQRRFPDDFMFGAATASYQIEGAWNADGKSENIWDHITHTNPTIVKDHSNGDIAADSYHNYKRDVEMMRELGLDAYRFSLSWSRILPDGFSNKINEAGVSFYNNYIDEMLKYGITPMITLYHWDLPQKFQDLGGFLNPLFPEWFEDYARVAYEQFGDRVKHWITFNEPKEVCYHGYDSHALAPVLNATGIGAYLCAKHLVLAHARAYYVYKNEYAREDGLCGITYALSWIRPQTDSEADEFAADLMRQAEWGLYTEPIFSEEGGFPKDLKKLVDQKSAEQGYSRSRMPEFTEEERDFVKGSSDFFGINHYTAKLISATENLQEHPVPSVYNDINVGESVAEDWPSAASSWLKQAPDSLLSALVNIKEKYNNPMVYITENGWSTTPDVGLIDDDRIRYYRAALENVLDALEAGVNLKGYMA
ncbi:unnamed protein product, partial [Iphiclides podalirius]